jgi:pyruvate carboxylase
MRVVRKCDSLEDAVIAARSEALAAFGKDAVFLERWVPFSPTINLETHLFMRFLHRPKHIEVQVLSDRYGNHVHLFERDCSVQRKHQKVVEMAPSPNLSPKVREAIFNAAINLAKFLNYGKYPVILGHVLFW